MYFNRSTAANWVRVPVILSCYPSAVLLLELPDSGGRLDSQESVVLVPQERARTERSNNLRGQHGRKEIVAAFIEEVGLTKAGAATYYQIIKKGRR